MQVFKNRPLALAICAFALTSLIALELPGSIKIIGFLLFFAVATVMEIVLIKRKRVGKYGAMILLCALGMAVSLFQSWFRFQFSMDWFHQRVGESISVEGYVTERLDSQNGGSCFSAVIEEADGESRIAKVLLEFDEASSLQAGDSFRLTAQPRLPVNTEDYSEELKLLSDGYEGILTCDPVECSVLEQKRVTLTMRVRRWRDALSDRIQNAMGGEEGALAAAVFLGDRGSLSADTTLSFQRSGISHLLALSGLHISIFIGFWELLLRRLRVYRQARAVIVPSVAIAYLLLTGCALSTVRAVLMMCVVYLSYVLWTDYDSFTSLCIALLVILIFSSYAVADVAMWLSFVATAGIVIFLPAVSEWYEAFSKNVTLPRWILRFGKSLIVAVAIGLLTHAAILPLLAYFFGSASKFSVGLTLVLSPLVGAGIVFAALSLLLPWCEPILFLSRWIFRVILLAANRVSEIRNAVALLNGELTGILIGLLAVILISFAVLYLKRKIWLLIPIALSVVILGVASADSLPKDAGTSVTYVRNAYEEAIVIADGKNAVAIDCSGGSSAIGFKIRKAVLESKCTELQELILTHYHSQASHLISSLSGKIKVRALRLPEPNCEKERAIAKRLEQEAELHGLAVYYGTDQFQFENVEICLWEREAKDSAIEIPVVFSMEIGEKSLVYLGGNAWSGAVSPFAESASISADWLILGAHGASKTPSEAFFESLDDPDYVIFGSQTILESCPRAYLPRGYCCEVETKQFFFKRAVYQ